jgi:autoinducer 2-degrading protein
MHVALVHVHVNPGHIEDFIAATRENHLASIKEPGNFRFDVLQSADDPTRFILYEAYASDEAARAHKHTDHYMRWRDSVGTWMATPRRGMMYKGLFPAG